MNRPFIIAAIGIVIVALAIGLNYLPGSPDETGSPAVTEKKPPPPQVAVRPEAAKPTPPTFDVVRVNPNGDTVMAGRAKAASTVAIVDNGAEKGRVKTDKRGEWVFVPEQPLKPGEHRLSLKMLVENKPPVPSTSNVMLVVPERGKNIAGQTGKGQTLVLRVGPNGKATVLQNPGSDGDRKLTVDAVDYDDAGRLFISGRAAPGATVQLYLNNRFIGQARAGKDNGDGAGAWTMSPENPVAPGIYKLRADQVDDAGKVLARVEFPFSRAKPILDKTMKASDYVTVQPGNSLWRLARRTYGDGIRYTIIYQANASQISNPDLIYPGQRFRLPEQTPAAPPGQ